MAPKNLALSLVSGCLALGCSAANYEHLSVADEALASDAPRTQAFQQSSTYQGTADATLVQPEAAALHGSDTYCRVLGGSTPQRCVLRWDISAIPSSATVVSASLQLGIVDPSRASFRAYALKREWSQADASWLDATAGAAWGKPGAASGRDRSKTAVATFVGSPARIAEMPLDTAAVQAWVSHPDANHGLVFDAAKSVNDGVSIASSEDASGWRPSLQVTYRE